MLDLQTAFDHGFEAVKAYVDAELGTLAGRLAVLEAGAAANGAAGNSGGLDQRTITALARGLMPVVRECVAEAVAPLGVRIAELELTQLRDGGTWAPQKLFHPNQIITHDGTLWICRTANSNSRPPSDNWRLMVKTKGRQ